MGQNLTKIHSEKIHSEKIHSEKNHSEKIHFDCEMEDGRYYSQRLDKYFDGLILSWRWSKNIGMTSICFSNESQDSLDRPRKLKEIKMDFKM